MANRRRSQSTAQPPKAARKAAPAGQGGSFPIVGIGSSAGGMEAVLEFLAELPASSGMAFVLVQHLDPNHESILPSILQRATPIPVHEVTSGMRVERDHFYVIPPNATMTVERRILKLTPRNAQMRHMPIDSFFLSLAADLGSKAIGVILSGTASDGVVGLETIKAEGGITFAQDEKSAKFPDMPRNAAAAGCVDFVVPPAGIARELARIARHPYVMEPAESQALEQTVSESSKAFVRIFALLRKVTQVDFGDYKRATIRRRIARRMALHKIHALDDYVALLESSSREVEALCQDILIKVTGFFRDPAAFDFLKAKVFPAIHRSRAKDSPLRIWVPGAATGEEAYSIAIGLVEYMQGLQTTIPCQVFATDLSELAIEHARAGVYRESIAADVSPERLRRFFTKVDGGFQVSKMIRDMCVIARQDLVKDPPFSRLDLISCRNLLIYLEPVLHRKVFPIFHYALRPGGYLMLGTSETVGAFGNLFSVVDRKQKVYARKQTSSPVHFDIPRGEKFPETPEGRRPAPSQALVREADIVREVDRLILSRYTPGGVIVDGDLEILQFRGQTDPYLHAAPGRASLNLLKMVREGLLSGLRSAFQKAKRTGRSVRTEVIPLIGLDSAGVRIEIVPLSEAGGRHPQYLVLFNESPLTRATPAGRKKTAPPERYLEQMRQELAATKEHLQSIIEEQETTNEELKSANEEIMSSNEELQSTNEELETAKEELQSTNEELTTLNEELQTRNLELSLANNDISNFIASVDIPVVMLGSDLRIRRFTPSAEKALNLILTDVGRAITDINLKVEVPDLEKLIRESIEKGARTERDVRDRNGRWQSLRIQPYRMRDDRIEGAVLIFLDIHDFKKSMERGDDAVDYAASLFDIVREALVLLDGKLRIQRVNDSFHEMFQLSQKEIENRPFYELEDGQWNAARAELEKVLKDGHLVREFPVTLELPRLGTPATRSYRVSARAVTTDGDKGPRILMAIH